jgi:glycosyltransferase involved in cell wall biosynthesis
MIKVLAVITTYNRPRKLLRLLEQFSFDFDHLSGILDIYIADDNPRSSLREAIFAVNSPLNISYHKNLVNLGQGPNLIEAISANERKGYNYLWCPGDDDQIIPDSFIQLIDKVILNQPSVAVLEFRQGPNLSSGTFFDSDVPTIREIDSALAAIAKFGKGTSAIFKYPDQEFLSYVSSFMAQCMYQDKALAAYAFLSGFREGNYLLVHSRLTAFGDLDYGKLRYSTRVFSNLYLTISHTLFYTYGDSVPISSDILKFAIGRQSPLSWWWFGIKAHLNPLSDIKYSTSKFFYELFFGWFVAIWYEKILSTYQPS